MVRRLTFIPVLLLTIVLVSANLAQLITSSPPDARDALARVVTDCCTSLTSCHDLFMDHRIDLCNASGDERRDAVLHHLLNGLCVLHPDVPSCKSFARGLATIMHLSYDICSLLLSAYKSKCITLSTFGSCCSTIGLKPCGTNRGRDLSHKLQQRLTRWGPLRDCENAIDMISLIESKSFGSGSLLEVASLHGIPFDTNISEKDTLRDAIVHHLVAGKCKTSNAALCISVCSVLLTSAVSCTSYGLAPLVLNAFITLATKTTLRRVLQYIGIPHSSTDSISILRSLLVQHRDATTRADTEPSLPMRGDQRSCSSNESGPNLNDVATAWPQRVSHVDKSRIIHDFRTATSSQALKTVTCASCAENVRSTVASSCLVSDLNLDALRYTPHTPSDQPNAAPPLPYTEGPLAGTLVDPSGVHRDKDDTLYLSLCPPCRNALSRGKLPRFALANLNVIGPVPPELQSLTLVEELIISRCRAKMCVVKLQDHNDDVELPTVQRGMKGHIIVFPQHPENISNVMPAPIHDIISPICVLLCSSTVPTPQWLKEKARPLIVRREVVLKALSWLRVHNPLYHEIVIDPQRISMLPENDILDYHIEQIEVSSAARTVVSRYDLSNGHPTGPPPDSSVTFESVLVTDVDVNAPSHQLKAAALRHAKRGGSFIQVPHDPNPVNEFFNPVMFPMLYPTLFPYGIGGFEDRRRLVPIGFENHVKHMLSLSDRRFQEHYSFMFVAFNVIQRRKLLLHTSLRVNRRNFHGWAQRFADVSADTMQGLAERASSGSLPAATTEDEKRALELLREVKLISANIPGSAASRLTMRNEIRANILSLGVPSFYVTVNPADVYNPMVRFLAGNDIDIDNLLSHEIPTYWEQAKTVARNPCIAAEFFHVFVTAFISAILGYDPKQRSVTPGILGVTKAYYGCVEAQGRGSLHCHMVVWVLGGMTSDQIRERAIADEGWRDRLIEFLDDTVCNVIPADPEPSMVIQSSEHHPCAVRGIDMSADPSAEDTLKFLMKDLRNVVSESQRHSHTKTCYKYSGSGEKSCRFNLDEDNVTPTTLFNEESGSLVMRHLDGMVNNYNPSISLATRCNGDIKFMASGDAAKSVLFYITDYITKTQLKSHISFSALEVALKKLQAVEIDDPDLRAKRMLQKCVYSIISHQELSGQQVVAYLKGYGDHYSSNKYRNLYWTAFEKSVDAEASSPECYPLHRDNTFDQANAPSSSPECDPVHTPPCDNEQDEEDLTMSSGGHSSDGEDGDEDVTIAPTRDGNVVQCSTQVQDYRFRSPALSHLSVWHFVCQVDKVSNLFHTNDTVADDIHSQSPSDSNSGIDNDESRDDDNGGDSLNEDVYRDVEDHHRTSRGRKSRTFPLHPQHAQSHRKAQRVRNNPSTYFVPVPIGPALPRRDRPELYPKYCRLMLILFKPWRVAEDLRTPGQSWAQAFEEFLEMSDNSIKAILDNMQVLHECRDAKDTEDRRRRDARRENAQPRWSERNGVEQFAGETTEDDLLDHIDAVVNYASERNSRTTADVVECLDELDQSGIFSSARGPQSQSPNREDAENAENALFLPPDLPLEDMWRTTYDNRRSMWKQKLCEPAEPSVISGQPQNIPTVSNLDKIHAPSVGVIELQLPPPPENINELIGKWTLNTEQARAFSLIASHSRQTRSPEPMRMYLGGPGGTGKSRVIAALTDYFAQRGESRRLRLASFTGIAAKNINGTTLHTALALSLSQKTGKRGNAKTKADLIAMWMGVDYLFIDEVSMIGCALLLQIHEALVDARGCTEPFGGISLIFAGDFAQLPPVNQVKLFSRATSAKESTVFGLLLWRSVTTVVMLTEQMRQAGPENTPFVEMLSRLRDGRCTLADYDLLNTRLLRNVIDDEHKYLWHDAPMIVYSNAIKDAINLHATLAFARRTGQCVHWYHSIDTYKGKPIKDSAIIDLLDTLPSNKTGGRIGALPLVLGMPVVITENFDVMGGIVNGSKGTLRKVRYRVGDDEKRYLTSCIVELPDLTTDPLPNLPPRFAAVLPDEVEMKPFRHPNSGRTCTLRRFQVPLEAAFAITAHKSQGQTMDRVVVDLNSCIGTEAAYVMISRCVSLDGLSILRPFPISKITTHRSQEARDEFKRLDLLRAQTTAALCGEPPGGEEAHHEDLISDISSLLSSENNVEAAKELLDTIWRCSPSNNNGNCVFLPLLVQLD